MSTPHPNPADISDPEEILGVILDPARRGELYPYYHRMREIAPIHPTEQFSLERGWFVTSHGAVHAVLRNLRMLSDSRNVDIFDSGPSGAKFFEMMKRLLLYLDRPDHDRIRRLVSRTFTPAAIEKKRPLVQRVVDDLIDEVVDRGRMDLVNDFAYPLPIRVICGMLGLPHEDVAHFMTWAHDFARRGDVAALDDEVIRNGEDASDGFESYFGELISKRRASPDDDLMSALIGLEDERGALTDREIVATCVILLQAGHNTTADLTSMGVRALLTHRDQWDLLRSEPRLIANAVEELIRYDTSVQISQRVGPSDIELDGISIPAGEMCILVNGAANRDPARYPEPDRLDITRSDVGHLGFGLGNYVCLGMSLARCELQTAIGTLARRLPGLELASETAEFRPTLLLRGLESLPLHW